MILDLIFFSVIMMSIRFIIKLLIYANKIKNIGIKYSMSIENGTNKIIRITNDLEFRIVFII